MLFNADIYHKSSYQSLYFCKSLCFANVVVFSERWLGYFFIEKFFNFKEIDSLALFQQKGRHFSVTPLFKIHYYD